MKKNTTTAGQCCSKECSSVLRKKTCLAKYGVEAVAKLEGSKEKTRQTCLAKYGVESHNQSQSVKDKKTTTSLEHYGVTSPFQSDEVKDRLKATMEERYGGIGFGSKSIADNIKATMEERYGGIGFGSKSIADNIKATMEERYGVANAAQSPELKQKVNATVSARFGSWRDIPNRSTEHYRRQYGVNSMSQLHLKDDLPVLNDESFWKGLRHYSESFDIFPNVSKSTLLNRARLFNPKSVFRDQTSLPHRRVIELLEEHGIDYRTNNRQVIPPLELDIFIPSKNLAIEVNGVYWHSELNGKDKNYHLNKTLECEKKNITLLQFWDIEVEHRWEVVSSMVLSGLGALKDKVYGRECVLRSVTKQQEKDFLEKNHLQGYVPSSICYGLYHGGELVSLMSFGKPRYDKKSDWELLRFCNRINTRVVGGASKLFKMKPEGSIVSYSDRRYSRGGVYRYLGFGCQSSSNPNYFYTRDCQVLESRIKYQKHKLANLLDLFDSSLTEWENMKANGYDRVWDCR